jgi:CDP-L-myo-inositol myo-inositolphosphotransferase
MKCVIIAAGKGERLQEKGTSKPLVNFLGLPLIERTIRAAKKAGASEFFVVTGHEKDSLEAILKKISKDIGLAIHAIYNTEWEHKSNGFSVLSVKDKINEPFLLLMSDHLFDSSIVTDLFAQSHTSDVVLAVDKKINNPVIDLEIVTKVKIENNKIIKIGKNLEEYNGFDTGIFYCTPVIFKTLELCIKKGKSFLSDAIQYLADSSKVGIFEIEDKFWADVNDPVSYRKAESEVLRNLNKQHDGIIARYCNRPISIWISKKLVVTKITPNQISIFAFTVGCIASFLFAMGLYIPLIIGGILAQISSIIDGCDGEVARMKYQDSSYGGWFDAVLDRYVDAFLLFGLTWHLNTDGGGNLYLIIGFFAITGSFMLSYTADKYDNLMKTLNTKSIRIGRDMRIFVILLGALLNQVELILIFVAVVMNIEVIRRLIISKNPNTETLKHTP